MSPCRPRTHPPASCRSPALAGPGGRAAPPCSASTWTARRPRWARTLRSRAGARCCRSAVTARALGFQGSSASWTISACRPLSSSPALSRRPIPGWSGRSSGAGTKSDCTATSTNGSLGSANARRRPSLCGASGCWSASPERRPGDTGLPGSRPIPGRRTCSPATACPTAPARWATTSLTAIPRTGRDPGAVDARGLGAVCVQRRPGMGVCSRELRQGIRPLVAGIRGHARLRLLLCADPASMAERPALPRAAPRGSRRRHAGKGRCLVRARRASWPNTCGPTRRRGSNWTSTPPRPFSDERHGIRISPHLHAPCVRGARELPHRAAGFGRRDPAGHRRSRRPAPCPGPHAARGRVHQRGVLRLGDGTPSARGMAVRGPRVATTRSRGTS